MIGKLGLIFECDAGGPDELVFKSLVRRLSPETEVIPRPLGSKKGIYNKGTEVAKDLVELDGCDLVLIVWDLKPLWKEEDGTQAKNCKDERKMMLERLTGIAASTLGKVRLLCLTYELETWLLADDATIRAYLSKETHPCTWKVSKPASYQDAKAQLNKVFNEFRGRKYEDYSEAIKIASKWTSTSKLRKIPSFKRFSLLLNGNKAAEFQKVADVCGDLRESARKMGR